jgi:hypothetical protein
MDREHLLTALDDAGEAAALCRQALLAGAELVMLPGTVPTAALRDIYRSRAEHLREHAVAAIGADDAADRLDRTGHPALRIGSVEGGSGSHFSQLFFDPAATEVVACLAVPDRDADASQSETS